jgi:hypothetical protein
MNRFIIFTDLDGTLLDHHTYSYVPAMPALERLRETKTPLIMVSSKTRLEIEALRIELDNQDPFPGADRFQPCSNVSLLISTPIERKRSIEALSIQPFGPELTTEGLSAISLGPFD